MLFEIFKSLCMFLHGSINRVWIEYCDTLDMKWSFPIFYNREKSESGAWFSIFPHLLYVFISLFFLLKAHIKPSSKIHNITFYIYSLLSYINLPFLRLTTPLIFQGLCFYCFSLFCIATLLPGSTVSPSLTRNCIKW